MSIDGGAVLTGLIDGRVDTNILLRQYAVYPIILISSDR